MPNTNSQPASWLAAIVVACAGACAVPAGPAAAAAYGFEDQPIGVQTPFTADLGGVTALFAGPAGADPGTFQVSYNSSSGPFPAPYRTLTNAFLTVGPSFAAIGAPLTIAFSSPVTAISLLFALDDPADAAALSLSTNASGAATARGTLTTGFRYPEGVLSFSGAAFTAVTLISAAPDFQVDDLSVTLSAAAVPEPVSLAAAGAGLAGLAMLRRRRI